MRIVNAYPPNIEAIDAAFKVKGQPILYAYGDKIFNPAAVNVPPHLIVHEEVHGDRQGTDVDGWWDRYIADPEFRLAEELPAHVAEFKALCAAQRHRWVSERSMRRVIASDMARKLAAPLYGNLISVSEAKKAILAA